jgi:hypothetical protein
MLTPTFHHCSFNFQPSSYQLINFVNSVCFCFAHLSTERTFSMLYFFTSNPKTDATNHKACAVCTVGGGACLGLSVPSAGSSKSVRKTLTIAIAIAVTITITIAIATALHTREMAVNDT